MLRFTPVKKKVHTYNENCMSAVFRQPVFSPTLWKERPTFKVRRLFLKVQWWVIKTRETEICAVLVNSCRGHKVSPAVPKMSTMKKFKSHRPGVKEGTGWWWFSRWCRNGEVHLTGFLHSATPASPWPDGNLPSLLWWFHGSLCGVWKNKRIFKKWTQTYTWSQMYYYEMISHNRTWDMCSKEKSHASSMSFFPYLHKSTSRDFTIKVSSS